MQALVEIDALVAEKVMGYERIPDIWAINDRLNPAKTYYYTVNNDVFVKAYEDDEWIVYLFNPSRILSCAWEVVEKLKLPDHNFSLFTAYERYDSKNHEWINPGYEVHIDCNCTYFGETCEGAVWAETAPLAICLAALKAVGVEVKKR